MQGTHVVHASLGDLVTAAFDAAAELTQNPELAAELATWVVAQAIVESGEYEVVDDLDAGLVH